MTDLTCSAVAVVGHDVQYVYVNFDLDEQE